MDKQHAAELLERIPLFADLSRAELIDVLTIAKYASFEPDARICSQGDSGESMYVIESGRAVVSLSTGETEAMTIATLEAGDVFGELTLIDREPRSANVTAETAVNAYRFDRQDFNALRRSASPAAYKVMRQMAVAMCARLRDVNSSVTAERGGRPRFTSVVTGRTPAPRSNTETSRSFWRGVLRWVGRG